ncbi:MFS transporter [Actibacterium sp. 188UL27-1]|uniref:MFS transporter n=1 Tax=Actibacterium sp. 188UL27-1 TaxID=2786961 RepID=UPI00195718B1|nr:MFS transporter [Actibacterium sp. 188UL27-1]MBM7068469.1 MFS transporter [Actibacterium sp. 188UL27-1]
MTPNSDTKQGGLRRLLLGQVPADFADWLDFVAIGATLAFTWAVGAPVFAILAVSMGLPYLLIGPFAGAFVDRCDTRTVLIWSNVGRAVATAALCVAPDWPTLMVVITIRSCIDTFFTPAKQSAIQALTTRPTRTRANALSHGINQTSKIIAPAMGGALLIWISPQMIFALNAVVSLLAAAIYVGLHALPPAPQAGDGPGAVGSFAQIRSGLSDVSQSFALKSAIGLMAGGYFAMFFYDTLIAPLTRDLGFDPILFGYALAAVGAGGVLGSAGMTLIGDAVRPFLTVAAASALAGLITIGIGVTEMSGIAPSLPVFLSAWGGLGVMAALSVIPFRTVMQTHCPERSIGQITALSEAVNTVALLTAPFIGALVAAAFSIGAAFVLGGSVMLVVGLAAFGLRRVV